MKSFILSILIVVLLLTISAQVNAVYAQSFKFQLANPATPAAAAGGTFDVKVLINTAAKQVLGADAIATFDGTKVGIKSSQKGTFFEVFQDHSIGGTTNKYLLSAWQSTEVNPVSSSADTLFSTLTFDAKAGGPVTISLDCTSGSTDSNIWDTAQTDIIKCAETLPLTINIGAAATPAATLTPGPTATPAATVTPRPTSTPVPTNTPRPTIAELPRTGAAEVTFAALGFGLVLTIVGILVIL